MNPLADITTEDQRAPAVVAHVEGEIDLSNVDEIRALLVDAVGHDTEHLILDLTGTTYLDSTGVRLLFELAERLQGRRQQLRLVVDDERARASGASSSPSWINGCRWTQTVEAGARRPSGTTG